jgi:hypothetical protein
VKWAIQRWLKGKESIFLHALRALPVSITNLNARAVNFKAPLDYNRNLSILTKSNRGVIAVRF